MYLDYFYKFFHNEKNNTSMYQMNFRKFMNSFKRKRAQLFVLTSLTLIYLFVSIANYFQIFQRDKPYFEIQDPFTYVFIE